MDGRSACWAIILCASLAPPVAAQAGTSLGDCSWLTRTDPTVLNVYFPEQNATYYTTRIPISADLKAEIVGEFPHARYISFASTHGGPLDTLTDVKILPRGDTNPFQPGADRMVKERNYTIPLLAQDVPANEADRVPGALYLGAWNPRYPIVHIVHRIYVPDDGRGETGGVPLAKIVFRGLPELGEAPLQCDLVPLDGSLQDQYAAMEGPDMPVRIGTSRELAWDSRDGTLNNDTAALAAGNEDNNYLLMTLDRYHGDVVAFRGLAPTTPSTRSGELVMGTGDLRFWSVCTNSLTMRVFDCLGDEDIVVDEDGTFTFVISTPSARPPSAQNWLAFGPEPRSVILLRHMLPSPEFFPFSAQGWRPDGPALPLTMGPYYPVPTYCDIQAFEVQRCGLGFPGDPLPSNGLALPGTEPGGPPAPESEPVTNAPGEGAESESNGPLTSEPSPKQSPGLGPLVALAALACLAALFGRRD